MEVLAAGGAGLVLVALLRGWLVPRYVLEERRASGRRRSGGLGGPRR